MRILIENKIKTISADNLTSHLESGALHVGENMLNEYPTVQWISSFPDSITYNSSTQREEASVTFYSEGVGSMNGIYLGNFNGDYLEYEIEELTSTTTGSYVKILDLNGNSKIKVPIRIYNSFGHFVRGIPSSYDDYMYTLENLGMAQTYTSRGFKINVTIKSEINNLTGFGDVYFKANKAARLSYIDQSTNPTRRIWKIKGNLVDAGGDIIPIGSEYYAQEIHVGMIFKITVNNTSGTPEDRVAQVLEIRGQGIKENSITLLIRDFENEDGSGGTIEELFEAKINGWGTFVNDDDYFDISVPNTEIQIHYIFNSMRVGLLRAGYIEQFPNPQTGMTRNYKDYSRKTETLDGGHHAVNRNIAKIYNGRIIMDRDRVRRFLTFSEYQRAKPFPVEIISNMEEETPTVFYGFFSSTPSENLSYRTGVLRDVDFSIQQVF